MSDLGDFGNLAFDVAIVGAGPVGVTCALALVQGGLSVAIIDSHPVNPAVSAAFDGRASAIAAASFAAWRTLGVADLLAEAEPIRSILVTDGQNPGAATNTGSAAAGGGLLRFDAHDLDPEGDQPMGYMVENRHARAALAQALLQSNATVFAPASLTGIETSPRGAILTLADGRCVTASLVVGAEGRASKVRQAAGIRTFGWDYRQRGVVATVRLAQPHGGVAHEYFLPGGPLAILPLAQDRASLVWTERAQVADALVQGCAPAFEAHLARRFGDLLGTPVLEGERHAFPLSLQVAEHMVGPRTALIGDAAHAIHPIAGQGLNLGLKDACALAEVIADAARLGEDIGGALVLERYARWRRFDAAALAVATDLFTRVFSNDIAPVRAIRGLGLSLVNRMPGARRLFVREAAGLLGDTPRLSRGETV